MTEHHDEKNLEQGVMVDVGPGAGALVIYTRDELRGQEIEISPDEDDAERVHTDVLRRKTADGYVCAAVFGSLPEGDYRLWHETLTSPTNVRIVGGEVTELDWRRATN
jgi:PAS domain-containing protein